MLIRLIRQIVQNEAPTQPKRLVRPRHVPLLFQAPALAPQERPIPVENRNICTAADQTTAGTPLRETAAGPSRLPRIVPAIAVTSDNYRASCASPIKAAPPTAATGPASPQRKTPSRPKGRVPRRHVPLLFGPHLDGVVEALAPAELNCPTPPPELVAADTSQIALVPAAVVPDALEKSPVQTNVTPALACTPKFSDSANLRIDPNVKTTEKPPAVKGVHFTLDTESFEPAKSPSALIGWVASFPTSKIGARPARRKRRRSGPLYYRPCLEVLEGRLVPATLLTPTLTTTQQPSTVTVGAMIADMATVTGSSSTPTGTVRFNLYSSPTTQNSGTLLFTDTESLASGSATSASYTTTAAGTVYWVDTYNGDSNYTSVSSGKAAEPVTINKATPTISTTQQPSTVTVGATIADMATITGGYNPSGTVTFKLYSNNTASGTPLFTDTESLASGSATSASYTTAAAGTDYWVATYNGDSNNNSVSGGDAAEPVTISKATPSISTTQQPSTVTVGAMIADMATITGGFNPSGTVTFRLYSNNTASGTPLFTDTESLASGSATSASYTTAAAGTDYWVATYNGDGNNNSVASGDAAEPVTVNKATPTISTTANPHSTTAGSAIQDTATVSGGYNPTGTVTFNLYANQTATGPALFTDTESLASGSATSASYSNTSPGTVYWVATYNGDSNNNSVSSGDADEPVLIARATPTISTTANPSSTTAGSSIQDTATVSGGLNPTGTVTFRLYNNNTASGTPLFTDTESLVSGSASSASYSNTSPGTVYWVATYSGDSSNNAVTSAAGAEPVTITQGSPSISTTANPSSITIGGFIQDTATVSGGLNPTGTISFNLYDNATASGTPLFTDTEPLLAGAATSGSYIPTSPGTVYWVAFYSGDSNNNSASSGNAAEPVTISDASPSITTSAVPNSTTAGSLIQDTATVTGGLNPTGTVTFNLYNNDTASGTPLFSSTVSLSGGSAISESFTTTAAGTDYWVASYSGDSNNNTAVSGDAADPVTITQAMPSISTTAVPSSTTAGSSIHDTATVSGGLNPTGTVTFDLYNNNTASGTPLFTDTESLVAGSATSANDSNTVPGTFYWVATYNGNSANSSVSSADAAEPVTITKASPSIGTTQQPSSVTVGTAIADKATVTGGDSPTGTVTFKLYNNNTATGTPLFTDTESLVSGSATSANFTTTAAGTDYWVATYNGNSNNNSVTSTDNAEPVTVSAASPSVTTTPSTRSVTLGTASVTLTDTANLAGGFNPTGTLTFTLVYGGRTVDTETATVNGNGNYTTPTGYNLPTTGTVIGTYQWNVSYSGDGNNHTTSENNNTNEQVTVSSATTSLTTNPNPTSVTLNGSAVTLTDNATLSGGYSPTGTITFKLYYNNGVNPVDTETVTANGNGSYSTPTGYKLPTSGTVTGTYQWDASYNGNANNSGASDNNDPAEQVLVNLTSTTTQPTTANANFNITGQLLTLSGSVTSTNGAVNGGTLTFTIPSLGLTGSGTVINGAASASFTLPAGTLSGSYTLTTTYSGNNQFQGSSDSTGSLTVSPPSSPFSTTTSAAAANPASPVFSTSNQSVTLSATVSTPGSSTAVNEGTVTFTVFQGSTQIGSPVTSGTVKNDSASATFTLPGGTAVGTYTIDATYNPPALDADFLTSSSSSGAFTIAPATTTTSLTTSKASTVFGQSVTYTATVTSSGGSPSGTVTFMDGSILLGSVSVAGGTASLPTTATPVGSSQTITASFQSDSTNFDNSSGTTTQTVNKASTTATVTSSASGGSVFGQTVTFTATVAAVSPGSGTPGGTVQFIIDGTNFGSPVTLSGGTASISTNSLSVTGSPGLLFHSVTAVFTDTDGNFNGPTTAPAIQQIVNLDGTTTAVALTSGTPTAGNDLTFTATVSPKTSGSGTPTGTVTFTLNGNSFANNVVTLSGGQASIQLKGINFDTAETYSIGATYSGDGNFTSSNNTLKQNIGAAAPAKVIFSQQPAATATAGRTMSTVAVEVVDQFNNVETTDQSSVITVTLSSNSFTAASTTSVTVVNGVATFSNLIIDQTGTYNLIATDTSNNAVAQATSDTGSVPGKLIPFTVEASGAASLVITTPQNVNVTAAGVPFPFTVTAFDQFGNIDSNFTDKVNFTSANSSLDVMPANYTFTGPGTGNDNGAHEFNTAELVAAGANFITVTDLSDPTVTGFTFDVSVNSQPTAKLVTTASVTEVAAGTAFTITVTAYQVDPTDSAKLIVNPNFVNAISFISTDPKAVLPDTYTFTGASGDVGTHTFSGVILKTSGFQGPGPQTITAIDAVSPALGVTVQVDPLTATHLGISFSGGSVANTPGILTIRALDQFGNIDPTYAGTVALSLTFAGSSSATVTLPAAFTYTTGTGGNDGNRGFSLSLSSVGSYTFTATGTGGLTGSSTFVVVTSSNAAATTLVNSGEALVLNAISSGPAVIFNVSAAPQVLLANNTSQSLIQTPNRDALAAGNPATLSVEIEASGSNPAIALIASSSVQGLQFSDQAPSIDDFFLDENLLPLIASRRGDSEAAGADKVAWPAAALMSFAESGVWSVIATFLPDRATGQSNPPAYEGWKRSPFKKADELDDILRDRNPPKISAPSRSSIDPNAGSYLPPEDNRSRSVAARNLPDEIAVGLLPSSPSGDPESNEADRGRFFAGLTAAGIDSPPAGNSDGTTERDGGEWDWQMATALFAAGFTALCAVEYDPAAKNGEE